ncbi:MAG: polysaccharide deacetylase family protein, partial [Candidatus Krumholzibacteriota bacterium]|nr:polysaccharide deacetylase family protein [Candidatus Krumholzibacteriota bacterium]
MPGLVFLFVLFALAGFSYLLWRIRWGDPPRNGPGVLAYHKVTSFELGGTWITPGRFASQLDTLLRCGFVFIDQDDFLAVLEGRRRGDRREILLTFDDGYRMLASTAVPLLEERGIPALFFLVTSYAGRENAWELPLPGRKFDHLSWDEVRDLGGRNISFGSHGRSHLDLTRLGREKVREELVISKEIIESETGRPVKSFSYPFGRTNR